MFLRYFYNWGDISQYVSSAFLFLFLFSYTLYARWWKHPVGWVVNIYAASLLLIIIPSMLAITYPAKFANFAGTTWYKVLETCNLTFLTAASITGTVVWTYLHRQRRLPGETHGNGKKE